VIDLAAAALELPVRLIHEGTDWPAWITAGGTAIVAAFALVALASLRDARRTRHAAIVTDLSRRWDEPDATEARRRSGDYEPRALVELVERIYKPPPTATDKEKLEDVEELFRLGRWLNLLETVGVLYTERALSRKVIFKLWGGQIASHWERWREAILLMRRLERRPGIYFQQVAERMRPMLAKELQKARTATEDAGPDYESPGGAGHSAGKGHQSASSGSTSSS
jgi:hypothetical protein